MEGKRIYFFFFILKRKRTL